MEVMIEVAEVTKRYGRDTIFENLSLTVHAGEVLCIVGPSGTGKSTLLRCMNGLEVTQTGLIKVAGMLIGNELRHGRIRPLSEKRIAKQRRHIGMVFQDWGLFQHLTAIDNITLARRLRREEHNDKAELEAEARELLAKVGLAAKAGSYPRELSGGEQQRVAIARALCQHPKVILFDEPTSALDGKAVREVQDVIVDLAGAGLTMVVVTHDQRLIKELATRIVIMDGGSIIADDTLEKLYEQSDPRALRLLPPP